MSSGFYSSGSSEFVLDSTCASPVDSELLQGWPQKSMYVVKELLTTERGYVDSLAEVIQGYLKPLYEYLFSSSQGPKFIEIVFCDIQKLHNMHVDIYNSLSSSCGDPSSLGQVFVKNAENFKEYTKYCTNFPKCEELLQHVMKSEPETRDFIVQCQIDIGHCLPLVTYLHKPVQRILKYRLLLEQALKGMSSNMQGYGDMQSALQVMCDVASEINERKKQHENVERVENIQRSLKGLKSAGLYGGDLKSCGSLVFEEKCKLLGTFDKERIMMLFENCLLFLRAKGSQKYIYKWHVLVHELDICVVGGQSNAFEVFSVYKPSQKVTVEVKSTALRDKIVGQIQSLLVKDLKAQQNMRAATLRRQKPRNDNTQLESSTKQEDKYANRKQQNGREKSFNAAHKRSRVATDLQSRRRTRQASTRRWQPEPESSGNADHTKDNLSSSHNTEVQSTYESSLDNVSSINTQESTATGEGHAVDVDKKLRRRTAMKKKQTAKAKRISMDEVTSNSVEPPATISCSAPLLCSSSDMMWSVEGTGSSDDTNQLESSLDRGTRQHHYTELSNEVESSLDIRKRTPEDIEMPNWNFSELESVSHESDVTIGEDQLPEYPLDMAIRDDGITDRLRINSKDYDVAEASICSNISSLSPEDHYYLTSNNSSVVAGKDGDSITIYDNDSEESDEEEYGSGHWIYEDREKGDRSQQPHTQYEGNVVDRSLRSYLSMAELWTGSLDEEEERSISPLATLPRVPTSSLVSFRSRKPSKLPRSSTVDAFQSLPVGSLTTDKDTKIKQPLQDDKEDLLESFSLSLPKTPVSNGNCHRDSWLPSNEEESSSEAGKPPWIIGRYLSGEDQPLPTYQSNAPELDDNSNIPTQDTTSTSYFDTQDVKANNDDYGKQKSQWPVMVTEHVTAYTQAEQIAVPLSCSQSLTHITVTSCHNGEILCTDKVDNDKAVDKIETVASILTHRRSTKSDEPSIQNTHSIMGKLLDSQQKTEPFKSRNHTQLVNITWTEIAAAILAKTMLTATMQKTALIVFIITIISACLFYFTKYYLNSVSEDLVK